MERDASAHLPLKPVDLQVLLALTDGELHGYGLVRAIAEASDGLIRLDPGNLYRVLKRLLESGLLAESERRSGPAPGDERRRYYRITALGKRVLAAELERLERLVSSPAVKALVRGWAS